jgi:hypothetical protein
MTEEQLRSMSEQEIRSRFRCAPAYYLQAKLDKKRVLEGRPRNTPAHWQSHLKTATGLPLPGFEILDAALSESDSLDAAAVAHSDEGDTLTQLAILEAALEDYSNWPLLSAPESIAEREPVPESAPASELERRLNLVLDSEPELRVVMDAVPDLELVLDSDPALRRALDAEAGFRADNVTKAHFGQRAPRTVPVVSVVMDRKRPNMVRVVGKSTRLAS